MKLLITNLERVYTQDGHHLGEAHRLHHRTHDVNPNLEQYDTYTYPQKLDHVLSDIGEGK